jgi:hypothetical protein
VPAREAGRSNINKMRDNHRPRPVYNCLQNADDNGPTCGRARKIGAQSPALPDARYPSPIAVMIHKVELLPIMVTSRAMTMSGP